MRTRAQPTAVHHRRAIAAVVFPAAILAITAGVAVAQDGQPRNPPAPVGVGAPMVIHIDTVAAGLIAAAISGAGGMVTAYLQRRDENFKAVLATEQADRQRITQIVFDLQKDTLQTASELRDLVRTINGGKS